ncbi:hypothetical protein [Aureimonas jatrophae]|jgi:hypothetical protein|uniref:Uncharacterized protein n=1 Tax=Aureimonas jatrophae TaxID=1166073 RepID=A0A1H0LRD0_9HYPH|nr:hypothetical protein [Aureimonas jatrophae]MBB3952702.1 hypothetical protein [Aureimonas jatrophae]SDO70674.1 hypothetical protein SAMN05192530_11112 [Aureimonas jatrophae]
MTMATPERQSVIEEIDVAVAEAIQACGGDVHETIASLIRAQRAMDEERDAKISAGYERRRLRDR